MQHKGVEYMKQDHASKTAEMTDFTVRPGAPERADQEETNRSFEMPAGMEGITEQILEEARRTAEEMERKAAEEAEKIYGQVQKEMEQWELQAEASLERELEEMRSRENSRREAERNRMLLETRQTILREMLEKAERKMEEAGTDEYFSVLRKLYARCAHSGDGVMYLGVRDFARMPAGFEEKLCRMAGEKGGRIILKKNASVKSGFLLVYGEIEENCTFHAMFDGQREELQDRVGALLWPGGRSDS